MTLRESIKEIIYHKKDVEKVIQAFLKYLPKEEKKHLHDAIELRGYKNGWNAYRNEIEGKLNEPI